MLTFKAQFDASEIYIECSRLNVSRVSTSPEDNRIIIDAEGVPNSGSISLSFDVDNHEKGAVLYGLYLLNSNGKTIDTIYQKY